MLASLAGAPDNARVTVRADHNRISIKVDGPGMTAVRTLYKQDGKLVLHNDHFEVDEALRGQGIGASVFGRQVEQAALNGVAKIETNAARRDGQVGYSVWPKFGYDGPLPGWVKGKLPEGLKGARKVGDLMKSAEGRDWWETNGADIFLTFSLKAGSQSRRVWDSYLGAKARGTNPTSPPGTSP
jgi:predicted GNAT family acetyltransferase